MGKKFLGLGGTDHFWDRAKAWILNQITSAVTAKIAEIVANAPEDLDTLKEIADWITEHADDAAAMNTQITENKNNIAALSDDAAAMNTQITENKNNIATNTSDISALKTSVAGKADTGHKHSADDITSGVLQVVNGGTGVTTQADINKAFIGNLETGESDVTDGTEFVSSYASNNSFSEPGYVNTPLKRKFSSVWGYIKGKISSVLGLTKDNYGGKASTAGTADNAVNLTAGAALNGNNKITTTNPTKIGAGQIKVHTVYGGDGPATYGNLINIGGSGGFQFFVEWTGSQTEAGQDLIGRIFTRFWRDNQAAWTAWKELAYNTGNVTFTTAKASNKMVIPIGAPSSLEDGCIWIER